MGASAGSAATEVVLWGYSNSLIRKNQVQLIVGEHTIGCIDSLARPQNIERLRNSNFFLDKPFT